MKKTLMSSKVIQESMRPIDCLKALGLLALVGALVIGNVTSAKAGLLHARSIIGAGVKASFATHNGAAHAERHQGTKYRVSHEELGNNYTYGNAGSGHADHHGNSARLSGDGQPNSSLQIQGRETPIPVPGSRGSSQYVKQTWLPNATPGKMDVAWTRDSFLQVDPSEVTPGSRIVSRASLTVPGILVGTVELSVRLDEKRKPKIETNLTGIFKGLKFELVSHQGGAVSLHFKQPLIWIVPGTTETLEISLDASIDVERM